MDASKIPGWSISLVIAIVAAGVAWGSLTTHVGDIEDELRKDFSRIENEIHKNDDRTRQLEITNSKILETLRHIENKLDKLNGNTKNQN